MSAMNERMLRAGAGAADGVVVNFCPAERAARLVPLVQSARAAAGGTTPFEFVANVWAQAGTDAELAQRGRSRRRSTKRPPEWLITHFTALVHVYILTIIMDMRIDLSGQVALVTGAGRGIGRAIACALAAAGAEVAVLARSADQVAETAALITGTGGHALALAGDVTDRQAVSASVQAVLGRFGRIDLLVNNAGANTVFGPVWEVDPDAWWADTRVNLLGPLLCSAAVLPAMVARRRGRIVNIASGTAGRAFPNNSALGYSVNRSGHKIWWRAGSPTSASCM